MRYRSSLQVMIFVIRSFYAATKAEVLVLTRRFAMELGRRGITVNAVAPGWIVAEMASAGLKLVDCPFSAVVVALIVGCTRLG